MATRYKIATQDRAETFTNKTLTSPVINDATTTRPIIGVTTWANRPAAASYAGAVIRISDIGASGAGSLWISDGTSWKPLNGQVVLAQSGVAVSVGAVTTEQALATITVPGGAMGLNGRIVVGLTWSLTNNGNAKNDRIRFSGNSGTEFLNANQVSRLHGQSGRSIYNRGAENSQVGSSSADGGTGNAVVTASVDTTANTTLVISGQKAVAGDTMTLERYDVLLIVP